MDRLLHEAVTWAKTLRPEAERPLARRFPLIGRPPLLIGMPIVEFSQRLPDGSYGPYVILGVCRRE